jgi:predicted dehydrogenase
MCWINASAAIEASFESQRSSGDATMKRRKQVRIGIIGAGFLAETRARCYAKVAGHDAEIVAVAARTEDSARKFAARHGVARACHSVDELLGQPEIDMVDLCIPNHMHRPAVEAAAAAGKHIVCTKPLTAYVGQDLPEGAADADVSGRDREVMRTVAVRDAEAMVAAAERAGVKLMYGENWIYAPSVQRAAGLMARTGGTILEMRGGECHSGSHSSFSKLWRHTGGGALVRLAAHPIGAMLYLKQQEGLARAGKPIEPVTVSAEVGDLSRVASTKSRDKGFIATGWQDVETWASVLIAFSDGSRGIVYASDAVLGGMETRLELFLDNGQFKLSLSPHDLLRAYAPDTSVFGDAYMMEKASTSAGWTTPLPDEDWSSGHQAMCQEFVAAVAEDRPAAATGQLGVAVTKVVYAAYLAADRGRRIEIA